MTLFTASIANGASLSGPVPIGAQVITGIVMPAAWTAASLTFQVSVDDGVTWSDLYDATGTEVTFLTAAGRFVAVDPSLWLGVSHVKVRSGTGGAAVNQGGARAIQLVGAQ
jgi:hypothetical protein